MNFIVCSVVGCQSEHSLWHILVLILLANIICGQTAVDWQLITISAECCVNSTTLLSSSSQLLSYLCTLYDSSAGELWRSALVFFYHPIKQTCTRTRTRAQHLGLNAAASKSWFFVCVCFSALMEWIQAHTCKADQFSLRLDNFMHCFKRVHSILLHLKYNKWRDHTDTRARPRMWNREAAGYKCYRHWCHC